MPNAHQPLNYLPGWLGRWAIGPQVPRLRRAAGIKHTKHLFERAKTQQERSELSQLTGVSEDDLLELVKLSDLARIVGVGPRFARLFYETGLDTLEKLIAASPEDLYERLIAVNQERGYTKTRASLKDVALCNQMAKDLPKVIEF